MGLFAFELGEVQSPPPSGVRGWSRLLGHCTNRCKLFIDHRVELYHSGTVDAEDESGTNHAIVESAVDLHGERELDAVNLDGLEWFCDE